MVLRSAFPAPPPNGIPPPAPPMICFKSANSHRDQPSQGRHPRNCRRFWSRKASILVTVVSFDPSCVALQKYQQSQGSAWSSSRSSELSSLLTPHAVVALQMYQQIISALYSLRQNFRHFWPLMFLSRFRCIDRSTITDISLL